MKQLCLVSVGLILIVLIFGLTAAHAGGRTVNLEWEADADALSYEIEIGARGSKTAFTIVRDLRLPRWIGQLRAGKYWMRVRGLDDRSLPGDWSDAIDFQIFLDPPELKIPVADSKVKAATPIGSVDFKWQPVEGAEGYSIVVMDEAHRPVITRKVKETATSASLPWASKYTWFVQAFDDHGELGSKPKEHASFILEAPALPSPVWVPPASSFVRTLEFERPKAAEFVRVSVQKFNPLTRMWQKLGETKVEKNSLINFKTEWPGGRYLFSATSEAKYHAVSEPAEITFDVIDGDRTIAAENRAFIRQAIDRTQNWFVTSSYVISQVTYSSTVTEENRVGKVRAITGTGLVGVGKLWPNALGVYASVDYGGMLINGKEHRFLGAEGSGLYRWAPQKAMDVRLKAGLFGRQFPQMTSTKAPIGIENLVAAGPILGGEVWYSLSPKLSLQMSLTTYYSAIGKSADGSALAPVTSLQTGVMGGLRLFRGITGLLGYSYRLDRYQYPGANTELGVERAIGESSMSGHYFQITLEYGF